MPAGGDSEIARRSRRRPSRPSAQRSTASSSRKGLEAVWGAALGGGQVHRAAGAVEAGARSRTSAGSSSTRRSTRRPKRCASRPRCWRPVLPESAPKIWAQLGMTGAARRRALRHARVGPACRPGRRSAKSRPVFPRIEVKPAVEKMRELEERGHGRAGRAARQDARAAGGRRAARGRPHPHRRFRQGGYARRPGAVRRAA